ncbi:DUF1707 and DUF4190 domain-containing protein [Streptomyces sp. CWNU-52B]|uniref:DUF1707 and DUF4190 domain-containing protein n=1 Tax=unclassified Streptomyces TaxID=2593676 RepID=UPI0039C01F1F
MSYPSPWQPGQGQGWNQPRPWQEQAGQSMLASTADRERAVDVLRAGFGEGRMQQPEFEKRVARAYEARTVGELAVLVSDLPQGPVPLPALSGPVPRTFLPAPAPALGRKTNDKAVGAAVCGWLCLLTAGLTAIPAVILGHTARSEIRHTGEVGEGLALTGLVFGWVSIAGWTLLMTLAFAVALVT